MWPAHIVDRTSQAFGPYIDSKCWTLQIIMMISYPNNSL